MVVASGQSANHLLFGVPLDYRQRKRQSGGKPVLGTGERETVRDRDRIVNLSDGVFAIALTLLVLRSEEHTSELQSRHISYAVFCLKKKNNIIEITSTHA